MVWLLVGGEGGKWKGLQKGVFMCCNVVMCGVVIGWGSGREMERVTERGFYVLKCGDVYCTYGLGEREGN